MLLAIVLLKVVVFNIRILYFFFIFLQINDAYEFDRDDENNNFFFCQYEFRRGVQCLLRQADSQTKINVHDMVRDEKSGS